MPPKDNEERQPSQSSSAWYGKIKRGVCNPDPCCNSKQCINPEAKARKSQGTCHGNTGG